MSFPTATLSGAAVEALVYARHGHELMGDEGPLWENPMPSG